MAALGLNVCSGVFLGGFILPFFAVPGAIPIFLLFVAMWSCRSAVLVYVSVRVFNA